jgi:hypothetical protein
MFSTYDDYGGSRVRAMHPLARSLDPIQADGRGGYTMQWEYAGSQCNGTYQASTKTAVLHLNMPASSVTITYRVLDANTMAVCIVEVDTAHTPTIQYGHMNRIERKYLDALTT